MVSVRVLLCAICFAAGGDMSVDLTPTAARGRLVVHVGAHKTGTSAFQAFLERDCAWLRDEFRIFAPVCGKFPTPKVWKVRTEADSRKLEKSLEETTAHLRSGRTVLISSEAFGLEGGLAPLRDVLGSPDWSVVVTLAHRSSDAWARSIWLQISTMQLSTDAFGATGLLRSFGEFVASEALAGPRSAFEGYENVLPFVRATDDVLVFSYDRLREDGVSIAAFLVCNASLRAAGAEWAACRRRVDERDRAHARVVSPSPAALDVVRLARQSYKLRCLRNATTSLSIDDARVRALAPTLPTLCDDGAAAPGAHTVLGVIAREADTAWLAARGALAPKARASAVVCLVDDERLTAAQLEAIAALAPRCDEGAPVDTPPRLCVNQRP